MLALALIVLASPVFLVDEGDPRCPAAALEEAVRARLPGVQVSGAPTGASDLRGSLRPAEGGFALEVRRADGEFALRRQFTLEDCKVAAETAALVIDRFLDEIHWSGKPPTIEPLPERPDRFEISAGPAVWLGTPDDVRAGAWLAATLRVRETFETSFLALGAASSATPALGAGSISVRQATFALSAAACAEPGGFRLCAGPLAGTRASLGSAATVRPGSAMLWQPELGIHARAEARLGARWLIGLQLAAAAVPGSATFIVADTGARRTLSKFDLISSISLAFQAF